MLIVFRGKPGTGKSTLADALSRERRAVLIDKDDVKDAIDGAFPDFNTGGIAYEAMLKLVERNLRSGLDVICDSPLTFKDLHDRIVGMAEANGHALRFVRTVCSDEGVWRRRLESRVGMGSHRMTSLTEELITSEPSYAVEGELVIDTSQDLELCVRHVQAHCGLHVHA